MLRFHLLTTRSGAAHLAAVAAKPAAGQAAVHTARRTPDEKGLGSCLDHHIGASQIIILCVDGFRHEHNPTPTVRSRGNAIRFPGDAGIERDAVRRRAC